MGSTKNDKSLGGRPTKLTPEIQEKIVQAIRVGSFIETAAAYAGVSKPTLYAWMRKGTEQKRGIHHKFLNAIQEAWASATVADLAQIASAAAKDWRAAAWRLEQRERNKYGPQVKISGPDGGPINIVQKNINLENLTMEELKELERILLKSGCGVESTLNGSPGPGEDGDTAEG